MAFLSNPAPPTLIGQDHVGRGVLFGHADSNGLAVGAKGQGSHKVGEVGDLKKKFMPAFLQTPTKLLASFPEKNVSAHL